MDNIQDLQQEVKKTLAYTKSGIKRRKNGALKYDYLVPSGVYEEQWDWDAFFMGVGLAADISSEGIYLKNWALNYILNAHEDGRVAGCITKDGDDPRLNHMKPLLAQGAYLASVFLDDFSWLTPVWDKMIHIVSYRERNLWDKNTDMATWHTAMESGADNNVASYRTESLKGLEEQFKDGSYDRVRKEKGGFVVEHVEDYPPGSIVSVDVNVYIYREYKALALIAQKLGKNEEAKQYEDKAQQMKEKIQKYLWNEEDGMYYAYDTNTGKQIKHVAVSSFLPLFAGISTQEQAKVMIEKYLWSTDHMRSEYGLRTLSKQDTHYNNINMLKPHSNWQGPVWPIANYIYLQGMLQYGYQKEALELAEMISKLVLADIKKTGGMHENYSAETGEGLAAPNFISWNVLVNNMIEEAQTQKNPFEIK